MFTSENESLFFLNHIKKTHKVLEYGSGSSTKEISTLCKSLVSIEHQESWYNDISKNIEKNTNIILCKPFKLYEEGTFNDGTYDEFKEYIEAPLDYGKFDIILIDGRARVECAKFIEKVSDKNTLIFIHDFTPRLDDHNYKEIFKYLNLIESVETMSKFKLL